MRHSEMISADQLNKCVDRIMDRKFTSKMLEKRLKTVEKGKAQQSVDKMLVFYYGLKLSRLNLLAQMAKDHLISVGVDIT